MCKMQSLMMQKTLMMYMKNMRMLIPDWVQLIRFWNVVQKPRARSTTNAWTKRRRKKKTSVNSFTLNRCKRQWARMNGSSQSNIWRIYVRNPRRVIQCDTVCFERLSVCYVMHRFDACQPWLPGYHCCTKETVREKSEVATKEKGKTFWALSQQCSAATNQDAWHPDLDCPASWETAAWKFKNLARSLLCPVASILWGMEQEPKHGCRRTHLLSIGHDMLYQNVSF